jgi:hypothetical protein
MPGSKDSISAEKLSAKISRLENESAYHRQKLRVCGQAWESANDLIRLAQQGDKLAALSLMMITAKMTGGLNSLLKKQTKLVRLLCRNFFA